MDAYYPTTNNVIAEMVKIAFIHSLLVRSRVLVILEQAIKYYARTRVRKPHL
jgi:hypothetical protein